MNITSNTTAFSLEPSLPGLPPAGGDPTLNMGELWAACRRHGGKLILWCALCVGLAIVYLIQTPPEYVASTLMLLDPVRPSLSASPDGGRLVVNLDAAQAESHIQVVKSERILRFVFDTLDLWHSREFATPPIGWREALMARFVPRPPRTEEEERAAAFQGFMGRVGARRIGQSYVIEVSYMALDAAAATRTVDSITSAYIWDQVASVRRGSEFLQTRIADIKAEEDAALQGIVQGRIPDTRFPDADAKVISAAIEPTAKSFPQSKVVLAFALTFALATGLGGIVTVHSFDRRIRTRRQIVRHLGLECLADVPPLSYRLRRSLQSRRRYDRTGTDDPFHRALRALRAVLISTSFDTRHRAIGLVSWRRGEGTTTIASGLARIASAASEHVALVDGNLQDPALTRTLAPNEGRGLTDSLLSRDPPERLTTVRMSDHLVFVPAVGDDVGTSPDAFAGLPEMQRYIDWLQREASVVVDLPAASVSSDARVIGQMLDGVVLVIEASRTTLDEAHDCIATLRSAKISVIGVVLNRTSRA